MSWNIIMIAWVIVEFGFHMWIDIKWADIGWNYCDLNCILRQLSIYKGGAAEIFKNIGDDYDNLLINVDVYVNWDLWETGTVTAGIRAQDIDLK